MSSATRSIRNYARGRISSEATNILLREADIISSEEFEERYIIWFPAHTPSASSILNLNEEAHRVARGLTALAMELPMRYREERSAEQDADDMNFTDNGGGFHATSRCRWPCYYSAPEQQLAPARRQATTTTTARVTLYERQSRERAVRDPEGILDPRAVPTQGCLASSTVCSKEIRTRPRHSRSRAPKHK
ncbi:hypothetical protein HPB51_000332 [Rhipicephalus microplus]|uniref:Tick transposon n=1 Tax=Rhipicephalus microplus TaxID=6941 RepID=A0A9J6E4D4_RHIMP|nr:hypothetical protein HPB51_000332 [Rhipicephalus microplus]